MRQVLAHPRAVLNQPIVGIAKAAQVSQPTVARFCRSLGCAGLSDFKSRLASGLTGTVQRSTGHQWPAAASSAASLRA